MTGSPKFLNLIKLPLLLGEDVDDDLVVVEAHPPTPRLALPTPLPPKVLGKFVLDVLDDGVNLRARARGHVDKEGCGGGEVRDAEGDHILRLPRVRRAHRRQRERRRRVVFGGPVGLPRVDGRFHVAEEFGAARAVVGGARALTMLVLSLLHRHRRVAEKPNRAEAVGAAAVDAVGAAAVDAAMSTVLAQSSGAEGWGGREGGRAAAQRKQRHAQLLAPHARDHRVWQRESVRASGLSVGSFPGVGSGGVSNRYNDKYLDNGGLEGSKRELPANIDKKLEETIKDMLMKFLDTTEIRGISRVDFLLHNEDIYLNEVNTIPGSHALYLWQNLGKSKFDLLNDMITEARDKTSNWSIDGSDGNALKNAKDIQSKLG